MIITVFGFEFNLLALAVFIFCTLFITEVIKKILKHRIKENKFLWIIISWIVGAGIFYILSITGWVKITFILCFQFALFVLLLNGGYKILKPFFLKWKEVFKK